MKRLHLMLLAALVIPGSWAESKIVAERNSGGASTEEIIARLTEAREANRAQRRPMQVVRVYKLFAKQAEDTTAEVTAYVNYTPPQGQSFTVHKDSGSGLGEIIVRKILESEKTVLTDQQASDISAANYAFRLVGEETRNGKPCFALELKPLRKEQRLLSGKVWVDKDSYLIVSLEGEPSQGPSWWVKNVHITLDFSMVDGMWVQSGLRSTASVRLMGPHTIVAHDVDYKIGGLEAAVR